MVPGVVPAGDWFSMVQSYQTMLEHSETRRGGSERRRGRTIERDLDWEKGERGKEEVSREGERDQLNTLTRSFKISKSCNRDPKREEERRRERRGERSATSIDG